MKVLIVEDDQNKIQQIADQVNVRLGETARIVQCRSFQSGIAAAVEDNPDLVVLDMSMPTFDITPTEQGGRMRPYAGRDMMREISRRRLNRKVIIVTQFETFPLKGEVISLSELTEQLAKAFPEIFVATVYYSASELTWRRELDKAIEKALGLTGGAR